MTGQPLLDGAVLAVSLFNAGLLFWLGFTVLLNTRRRTWAIVLTGGALCAGGAFFLEHAALFGSWTVGKTLDLWWLGGWLPLLLLPCAWYVVILWFSGFWENRTTALYRRHRFFLPIVLVAALGFLSNLFLPIPGEPTARYLLSLNEPALDFPSRLFDLLLAYPFYIAACLGLSLNALRHAPTQTGEMNGPAKERARPWLVATSALLLCVSLMVAGALSWITWHILLPPPGLLLADRRLPLAAFDLAIAMVIAGANLCLGQAIVAYEIFTGRTLPRRGLRRHWRNAILLSGGYGAFVAWNRVQPFPPIFALVVMAPLLALFYALFGWRSYVERERLIQSLRPLLDTPPLYDQLLSRTRSVTTEEKAAPFDAIAGDLLNASRAYLLPFGAIAPLVGSGLAYPDPSVPLPSLHESGLKETPSGEIGIALNPEEHEGARWAVPLWGPSGRIGALLLGDKRDGGLYAQEEIEVARAMSERLLDTQASAELARRLMAIQRDRLAETQVTEGRTRRILHDDLLPQLHAALLALRPGTEGNDQAIALLTETHRGMAALLREMPAGASGELARQGLFGAVRTVAEIELQGCFDGIAWEIAPEAERRAETSAPFQREAIFYAVREAIRNAARHGRGNNPNRPLHLRVTAQERDGLEVVVEDDGVGLAAKRSSPGGNGLALHSTMMAVIGGTLSVESQPGAGTQVRLTLDL